jgi:hypothetical protein
MLAESARALLEEPGTVKRGLCPRVSRLSSEPLKRTAAMIFSSRHYDGSWLVAVAKIGKG